MMTATLSSRVGRPAKPKALTLAGYLDGLRSAPTASELEAAIQAPYKHAFRGPTWRRICTARIEAGQRICAEHHLGRFVPRFDAGRRLLVCEQVSRVGRGGNSTGARYAWHSAGAWAMSVMRENGLSQRAAYHIWEIWSDYPHRALAIIEDALAGRIPDPVLNVMIRHEGREGGSPVRYTIEQNDSDKHDRRAVRPCPCGGTLFDWGGGMSEGFRFINWHCNACPDVFTEYMDQERLYAIRRGARVPASEGPSAPTV